MKSDKIEVHKGFLEEIDEDYSKISSLVDFVSLELMTMHENNNGNMKRTPSTTIYQLAAILENIDNKMMDRMQTINQILGKDEDGLKLAA